MVVPVLHQHGLRELQPLRSADISEKLESSHFTGLWRLWPVAETLGLASSFVALEKLRQVVIVLVLHQPYLRERQALQR